MARVIRFLDKTSRQHFATMFVVFASSGAIPQSMDDLLTAAAIKRKFVSVSDPNPNGARFDRVLRPGPQEVKLKESEWEYLLSRLRPPAGQWTNFGAEDALEIIEMIRETPREEDSAVEAGR